MREILKTLLTYSLTLPTPRLRSLEKFLDDLCRERAPPDRDPRRRDDRGRRGRRDPRRLGAPAAPSRGRRSSTSTAAATSRRRRGCTRCSPPSSCAATGCDLFIVDYRLAPEFPFPAGLDDAMQVFEALLDDGRPHDELFVAGDSGGGGLATSLFEDARGRAPPRARGRDPVLPRGRPRDGRAVGDGERAPRRAARRDPGACSTSAARIPHDPRVSVVYADVHRFPPTFIAYGGEEMFRDEIEEFIGKLKDADVEVDDVRGARTSSTSTRSSCRGRPRRRPRSPRSRRSSIDRRSTTDVDDVASPTVIGGPDDLSTAAASARTVAAVRARLGRAVGDRRADRRRALERGSGRGREPTPAVPRGRRRPQSAPRHSATDVPGARCGTVTVPLDRAHPDGRTIDIAFELYPHRDTSQPAARADRRRRRWPRLLEPRPAATTTSISSTR